MRVWFSDIYAHQPKDLGARKLGERGHHVRFIGYPHNSSGYRVYDPDTHKINIVRAPIFHEEACPRPSTTFESQANILDNDDVARVDDGRVGDGINSAVRSFPCSTDVSDNTSPPPPAAPSS